MKEVKLDVIVIVILFILLLNSFVLSYFYFQAYAGKETEIVAKESTSTDVNTESEATININGIMDKIYPKDTFVDGTKEYSIYHDDRAVNIVHDTNGKVTSANNCMVYLFEGEYQITRDSEYINNSDHRQDIIIKNLPASDVVDVKLDSDEEGSDYSAIYFLTRSGDVYYVKNVGYLDNTVNAVKLINVSNIVRIEIAYVVDPEANHGYSTAIGIDIDGNIFDLGNLAYEQGLIG